MNDFDLPAAHDMPVERHARRRAHLIEEARSRPPRHRMHLGVVATALGFAGLIAVLAITLAGHGKRSATPAIGLDGPILHIVIRLSSDGKPIRTTESWESLSEPGRVREVVRTEAPNESAEDLETMYVHDVPVAVFNRGTNTLREISPAATSVPGDPFAPILVPWTERSGPGTLTTVDGRPAVAYTRRFAGIDVTSYFDPTTHYPIRIANEPTEGRPGLPEQSDFVIEIVPAAEGNQSFLDLRAQHPDAMVAAPASLVEALGISLPEAGGSIAPGFEEPVLTAAEVAVGMESGATAWSGTKPTCLPDAGTFRCILSRPRTHDLRLRTNVGASYGLVDSARRIAGGCVAVDRDGVTWTCYLGREAVAKGVLEAVLLGRRLDGPAAG